MNLFKILFISGLLYLLSISPANAQETLLELYYSGEYETVISNTSEAIAAGDTTFRIFFLKALSEIQLGRTQNAVQTLETAVSWFPEDPGINRMLAGQYYDAGAYDKAGRLYSRLLLSDSTDTASLLKLAEIASFTQNYSEAIHLLQQVLALDSTNLNSLMMMGDILSRQNNRGAIAYYEKAYGIYTSNQKVAYALGNCYIQEKIPDRAIPICELILKSDSTNIKFQKLMGYAYYKIGDPLPGIVHFQKAVELGDSSVFTFKYMGIAQYMMVDFKNAIESLRVAVEKDTLDAENHFFLDNSMHRSKEALVDYRKFIDRSNRLPLSERRNSQIPSIKAIVEDRIVSLEEELFFLDEQ